MKPEVPLFQARRRKGLLWSRFGVPPESQDEAYEGEVNAPGRTSQKGDSVTRRASSCRDEAHGGRVKFRDRFATSDTWLARGSKMLRRSRSKRGKLEGTRYGIEAATYCGIGTRSLLPALNTLLRNAPAWLRPKIKEELTRVSLRPDGVRASLEFMFAAHPSGTVTTAEAAVPQKRGANITHQSLQLAASMFSNVPASVTAEEWYAAIAPQLLALLDGDGGPELVKVASYIIGFGILGRRSSGVPGTDGWKYFVEPILSRIKPPPGFSKVDAESDGIVDLSRHKVLVDPADLSTALRRLHSLLVSHPNPGVSKRLIYGLILQLWALASWPAESPAISEVSTTAQELLKMYMKLLPSPDLVLLLVRWLGYLGGYDEKEPEWVYAAADDGRLQIVDLRQSLGHANSAALGVGLEDLDAKVRKLLDLVGATHSDADIAAVLTELLKRWLKASGRKKGGIEIIKQDDAQEDPMVQMIEIKTLQAIMERFPEKLTTQPKHILGLASEILSSSADNDDTDEEVTGVALSLLNMIITTPGFQKSRVDPNILTQVESSLDKLSAGTTPTSQTASNLRLLLLYRDEVDNTPSTSAPTDRQIEDRKTYNLAISYIMDTDSPPPVRSEGLSLIGTLIKSRSPILDIPGILVLLSKLVSDPDEFIYLRVIQLYALLADRHPRSVARELTEQFVDSTERHGIDARLRFAEALAQVIQRMGETFAETVASEAGHALLAVAGRRGKRPRTEARRAREARAREKADREAAEQWGGEVPDFSEPETPAEKAARELTERIVAGWESQRGAEDVRVRASALAVLGTAVEVNAAGLGKGLVRDAVDLCLALLPLEREPEKGILRRAAVRFVLSSVRALEAARERGKELGFGFGVEAQDAVLRTLRYVAETDEDGLAKQHARDVVESLENWKVIQLLPSEDMQARQAQALEGGLTKLAGLVVDPERSAAVGEASKARPKIEEVE
ncbi:hypothetical protein VTJ49DRAFT_4771 [Mycothermus thermophilus]|uniref:RNA polymerase II assembly factor Rtp1 C-terminal domain-containing protein n=1 Tax=Humicola insolens TaxID=85995 RepID=A0ABR3VM86_HUMIN